jgi:branched-subunit amino acid aminotransferase/4-amino-4-deoxychorismate lyase
MIDPTDRGFTLGDGLFETVLVEDGQVRRLDAHLARLNAGCDALGLPRPGEIALPPLPVEGRHALRLSWSAGVGGRGLDRPPAITPQLTITLAPAPLAGPARLITARTVRRNEHSPASGLKTLSYLDNVLARAEARARGGDEAVMLNTAGNLACAAAANLFWIADDRLFTPALGCGALAGITRARLMAAHPVEEVVAGRDALDRADALLLTNSLSGVRHVGALDGRSLAPHPLAARLASLLA